MCDFLKLVRDRHSSRVDFDPGRPIPWADLRQVLEAARWAPTAHNMQNFQILVVDDRGLLDAVSNVRCGVDEIFVYENYQQLSFSEEELKRKKVGLLASQFPPSWRAPGGRFKPDEGVEHSFLGSPVQKCAALLVATYDARRRAPGSEGDFLGIMSLGCVLENMWLMAGALGIGFQVLSSLGAGPVEGEMKKLLGVPAEFRIGFAARLGYPAAPADPARQLRVRRDIDDFAHHNRFGVPLPAARGK